MSLHPGRIFMVDIVNKPNKKDPDIVYNNIGSVKALTDSLRDKYNFDWEQVTKSNPLLSFMIDKDGKAFQSEEFTKLPNYLQKKVKESDEGVMYLNNGGVFAEKSSFNNDDKVTEPPVKRTPTSSKEPVRKMLVTDYTYEQYIASKWTDEKLIEAGKMELIQSKAPSGPSGPGAPDEDSDVPF